MSSINRNLEIKQLSAEIHKEFENNKNCIRDCFVPSKSFSYDEFENSLSERNPKDNPEITSINDNPTLADFEETFKALEEYPPNINKPKKVLVKEASRLNSTSVKFGSSLSLTDSCSISNCQKSGMLSSTLNDLSLKLDSIPSSEEIYENFDEFLQKFNQLLLKLKENKLSAQNAAKHAQLNRLATQVDELLPTNEEHKQAFTPQEQYKFLQIVKNLEDFIFIQSNQNMFENAGQIKLTARLEKLIELLDYAFNLTNVYKNLDN